jgi:biopolymer transport protein ExbB
MLPLLLCSIISATVIIERFWFWWRIDGRLDAGRLETCLEHGRKGEWHRALALVEDRRDYLSIVMTAGIDGRHASPAKVMAAVATEEVSRMRRLMPVLDTMITAAPLLGILGTVIGIIVSFDILGSRGIEDPLAVTAGIAQALMTTAAGLTIAIFTVFPYNYFNARIARAIHRLETWTTRLEAVLKAPVVRNYSVRELDHEARLAN